MKTLTALLVLLITVPASLGQSESQGTQQRVRSWLSEQDQDNDGRISETEASGPMKTHFGRNDTDKDGFLDDAELSSLAKRLQRNTGRNQRRPGEWTDRQVRQRAGDDVVVELNIAYRDGNPAWKLDLARPKKESTTPRAAIVFVHGGGWVSGDKRRRLFIGQALEFARRGYLCISVNYRLDKTKLPCVHDVKCAVRWLRAHADRYNIDPNRIGAYGNSAGAHLVAMLGLSHTEKKLEGDGPWQQHSSAVQAVAASATPSRLPVRLENGAARPLISPMTYVSAEAPPFLLFHEESDRLVPISHSDDFVKALRAAGATNVIYRRYTDGSGHGVFGKHLRETSAEMARFFERSLKPTDDEPRGKLSEHLAPFAPLIGKTFRGEFASSTPQTPAVDIQKWERALNGQAVRLLHSVNDGQYGGETLFIWDKAKKSIVFHYFTTAGFTTQGTITFAGDTWTSHEIVKGGGAVSEVGSTSQILPDGSIRVQTKMLRNGKWESGDGVTYLLSPNAVVKFR